MPKKPKKPKNPKPRATKTTDGPVTFTCTLPGDMAITIKETATGLKTTPEALTSALLCAGLTCAKGTHTILFTQLNPPDADGAH